MPTKKMTITVLRDELVETFDNLKTRKLSIKDAIAYNNTASRIMQTAKIEMEYNKMTGKQKKKIPFLES